MMASSELFTREEALESLYTPHVSLLDRLRWLLVAFGKWLDALPVFWFAFAFNLTETVGATILALPIAFALIGPLAGAAVLVVIGAVNLLTVVCTAEAAARSGVIRYGNAFLGRLVADYLGSFGSLVFTVGGAVLSFMLVQLYYIGFSTVLADATGVSPAVWMAVLFAACLYFVSRRSLRTTASSALLVGVVNIALVLGISALGLLHARRENLAYLNLPLIGGLALVPSILRTVFGVALVAYFGHFSVGNCARHVLQRDPSGRGLIAGCAAAQVAAIVLYCLFVIAVNGALGPRALTGYRGTALEPLARVAGPGVLALGSLFVILGMGMAAVQYSLGLFNLIRERLPAPPRFLATLPAGGGRLVLESRCGSGDAPRLGLAYRGLSGGRPRLRVDVQTERAVRSVEVILDGSWKAGELTDRIPALRGHALPLTLQVIEANEESLSLVAHSRMRARYEPDAAGTSLLRLFELPDDLWQILLWIVRRGEVTLDEAAAHLGRDAEAARAALDMLAGQDVLQKRDEAGEPRYRARQARTRARRLPAQIWEALEGSTEHAVRSTQLRCQAKRLAVGATSPVLAACSVLRAPCCLTERARLFLSASPLAAGFLLTEWLSSRGDQSFTGLLSFLGLILVSLFGGIFPVLLLAASRRKGGFVPGFAWRPLGSFPVLAILYLTFLSSLVVHGLVIWQNLPARVAALVTAALALGATVVMARRGAFAPRAVVELREELREGRASVFSLMADGKPLVAEVQMEYRDDQSHRHAAAGEIPGLSSLRSITFCLPPTPARELKLWTHRVTPEGDSEPLPSLAEIQCGDETRQVDLGLCGGQVLLPIPRAACQLRITLPVGGSR
jgi:amino acid permease